MKLTDQVCTPEQGQRLAELGVKALSNFAYAVTTTGLPEPQYDFQQLDPGDDWKEAEYPPMVPAYTGSELGEMIPKGFLEEQAFPLSPGKVVDAYCFVLQHPDGWRWRISSYTRFSVYQLGHFFYPTEARARAALLIHLLKSGKVTAETVNERMKA